MKKLYVLISEIPPIRDTSLQEAEGIFEKAAKEASQEIELLAGKGGKQVVVPLGFQAHRNVDDKKEFIFDVETHNVKGMLVSSLNIVFLRDGHIDLVLLYHDDQTNGAQERLAFNIDTETWEKLDKKLEDYFSGKQDDLIEALEKFRNPSH